MAQQPQPSRSQRRAAARAERRGRLSEWLVPLLVAVLVGGAFTAGTRFAPKPVAPTSERVVQTQCALDTTQVQRTLEALRQSVNERRHRQLSPAQFEQEVAAGVPALAQAIRTQGVKCHPVP
jgi:hypothetical protein